MVDRHAGRDTGRIRAAGWGTDVHPRLRVGNAVGDPGADVSGGALMLQLTPQSRIFLAVEPIDFRAGIDRLAALCRERLAQNPLEGAVYVFRNRRSTALKLLLYDGQGFWLCTKRLSRAGSSGGRAPRPQPGVCPPASCTSCFGMVAPMLPGWPRTGAGSPKPAPAARCSSRATRQKGCERPPSDAPAMPPDRQAH